MHHPQPCTRRARGAAAALAGLSLVLLGAAAADAQTPAPRQERPVALTGATLHTVSGEAIEEGTLLFADGVITALGRKVDVPSGAERVDLSGKHVYPGLIAAHTHLGLYEIGGISQTIDTDELGAINPNVRAEVAVNPASRHIGVARSAGVLVAVSAPGGGLISGQAAALALDGWTWEQMTLRSSVALVVSWPGAGNESRYERALRELRDVFAEARAYRAARAAAGETARPFRTDPRWEAMIPVLEGEVAVMVTANELRQIQDAITWAEQEQVRLILRGGRDAAYVADHLARQQIPVLLTSVLSSPSRTWEPYDTAYTLPARLHDAGVPFAIAGGSGAAYVYRLPWEAGAATAFGLPEEEAVRAVTLHPARILGLDDRVGSLEVDRDATLIVTTGHPLDHTTRIERAYIQGRLIDPADVQRRLFEQYREKQRQIRGAEPSEWED